MPRKLAPGSLWTVNDQLRWYEESRGSDALLRQTYLGKLAARQCVCEARKLKRHWNGEHSPITVRVVHSKECPKYKSWMGEFQ